MRKELEIVEKIGEMVKAEAPFMEIADEFRKLAVMEHLKSRDEFNQDAFDVAMTGMFLCSQVAMETGETQPLSDSEYERIKQDLIAHISNRTKDK